MARIACFNDVGSHGGAIKVTGQSGSVKVGGVEVAVDGALYNCRLHGNNKVVTANTTKTKVEGKLVITAGARASCGSIIQPADRGVDVE